MVSDEGVQGRVDGAANTPETVTTQRAVSSVGLPQNVMSFTRAWWPLDPPPKRKMSSSTSGVSVSKCRPKLEDAAVSLRNENRKYKNAVGSWHAEFEKGLHTQ